MTRKRLISIAALALAVLLLAGGVAVLKQRLAAERDERQGDFIAIHFIAVGAASEYGEMPKDLDGLLEHHGGKHSVLMRPFPDGLVYKTDGDSFTLEEPRARRVSLFKKDRLIGTNRKWPRWEDSGEYARKFPEQEVPASGYE